MGQPARGARALAAGRSAEPQQGEAQATGRVDGGVRVYLSHSPETAGETRKLEGDLKQRLAQVLIYATEPVPNSADRETLIGDRVGRCDTLVAVIGPSWLSPPGEGRPGTVEPQLEVSQAFRRQVPVVPLLAQNAPRPSSEALPENLKPLAGQTPIELMVQFWDEAVGQLVDRISQTEQELRRRQGAAEEAAGRLRALQTEARKAREAHDGALATIEQGGQRVTELEGRIAQAKEEEERMTQEREDQNPVFLGGAPALDPQARANGPTPRLVWIGAAAIVLLIIIVIAL